MADEELSFGEKARTISMGKGKKVAVHTVRHEGVDHPRHGARYMEGEVAGIHLVHDDGRVDAIVGRHPDDADFHYWQTSVKKDDE